MNQIDLVNNLLLHSPWLSLSIFFAAYLFGSIPFGLVLCKLKGLGDIREIGSGNIGATNVLRTGNKALAATTLFLDGFKGFLPAFIITYIYPEHSELTSLAAIAAVLGHCFPLWLKFKGGKGVATAIGALFALSPAIGLEACIAWLLIAFFFRISSLAALVTFVIVPFLTNLADLSQFVNTTIILAIIIWLRHHSNLYRLLSGTEPRIGGSKNKENKTEEILNGQP